MDKRQMMSRFLKAAREQPWWNNGSMALAVSGGSDSMALLWFFLNCGIPLRALFHLDHGLRPSSADEALFVKKYCEDLGVTWIGKRIDVTALRLRGESEEEACRRLRYSFFSEAAEREGILWVASGHTMDDQAETVLMNLCRGAGLRGVAGIPPVRDKWVRPLLGFRRQELRNLLVSQGWDWVEDETNSQCGYLRNRVRHQVLPLLVDLVNSRTVEHLASLARQGWQHRLADEQRLDAVLNSLSCQNQWPWKGFNMKELRSLDDESLLLVLQGLARRFCWSCLSRQRWNQLCELIRRSGRFRFQWDGFHDLSCRDGMLWWGPSVERYKVWQEGTADRWGGWFLKVGNDSASPWSLPLPTEGLESLRFQRVEKGESWIEEQLPVVWFGKKIYARPSNHGLEITADGVQYKSFGNTLTFCPLEASQEDPSWTIESQMY